MKLLIDSADTNEIKKYIDLFPIDGITTNPTIIKMSGRLPHGVLLEIKELIGNRDLHIQTVSSDSDGIIEEAQRIVKKYGEETFIKIPVTLEGVRAIKILSSMGIKCTGTIVYTIQQAYMAAKAGAIWIAPYVNRIEEAYGNGVETVRRMHEMLKTNGFEAGILGASLHTVEQLTGLMEFGAQAATLSTKMLETFLNNENVRSSELKFKNHFESMCGKGSVM